MTTTLVLIILTVFLFGGGVVTLISGWRSVGVG